MGEAGVGLKEPTGHNTGEKMRSEQSLVVPLAKLVPLA